MLNSGGIVPYCPKCGVEYVETAIECADCRIPLKQKIYTSEDTVQCAHCRSKNSREANYCTTCGSEMNKFDLESSIFEQGIMAVQCENCNKGIPAGSEYCLECGYFLNDSRSCENHPDLMTDFVCIVCGRPFCENCGKTINDKFVCRDDENYDFVGNWVIAGSDPHMENLEPMVLELENHSIPAVIKKKMDHPYSMQASEYTILIPIIKIRDAEKILSEAGLVYENECGNCRCQFNGSPERCPNCGEEFLD
ncbi:zinc ribbon domain-containing protein [candidate division KSB1 bacterium]